jgi:5-methylcytosine-specific restriction endonuclease McrA
MPIRPENQPLYPPNWREIRAAILERAGHRCERCGVPNRVWRNPRTDAWTHDAELAETWLLDGDRVARIVLTVAHLDHAPEHNDPANLRALCQRCHLAYDADHHARTAYATRRKPRALGDLFDVALEP